MFQALGLSPSEENLYTVLVHSPRSTVAELAATGRCHPSRPPGTCTGWSGCGLANRLPGRRGVTSPSLPTSPSSRCWPSREDELRQARLVQPGSDEGLPRGVPPGAPGRTGGDHHRREQYQEPDRPAARCGREQIRGFDRPPYVMSLDENVGQEASRIREGVTYRVIYSAQAVMWPGRLEGDIRLACAAGEQARVRPDLPTKMWIVDDKMAMIPIKHAASHRGLFIVRPCDLLTRSSRCSRPSGSGRYRCGRSSARSRTRQEADEPDETRTAVLSCLAAGLTDEGIARSLGCSLRTAQRHIRKPHAGPAT